MIGLRLVQYRGLGTAICEIPMLEQLVLGHLKRARYAFAPEKLKLRDQSKEATLRSEGQEVRIGNVGSEKLSEAWIILLLAATPINL